MPEVAWMLTPTVRVPLLFPPHDIVPQISPAGVLQPALYAVVICDALLTGKMTDNAFTPVATYGPTSPTGAAPTGLTGSVEVSLTDRPRLTRPLPVWSAVPAVSALRASRPTITPGPAESSTAASSPADPATIAAAADVPVTEVVPPPACVVTIPTPGAARNVSAP